MHFSSRHQILTQLLLSLLLILIIISPSSAKGNQQPIINPIKIPIIQGNLHLHVRRYAKIPDHNGKTAKIVGITSHRRSLYVCTSVSNGLIYKVDPLRRVSLWFDVSRAMRRNTGRDISTTNRAHGGVRSIAFHPRFQRNGLFYVALMEQRTQPPWKFSFLSRPRYPIPADSVVYEWRVNTNTGRPLPWTQRQVLRVGMPVYDHPIKQMVFHGDDLYIAHGDGSVQSASTGGGQRNDALGKILRINPIQQRGQPYTIPRSNPYFQSRKFLPEIFAVGFRNPHNLCFSRRGELFAADSGRDNVEEINLVRAGGNYGWSEREGPFVHLDRGGLQTGVMALPKDDAKYGYTYPAAVVGHYGRRGAYFIGQAIAMGCPIENGSPMSGVLLYANFPSDGAMYYSFLGQLRRARTRGQPGLLWRARTYRPRIIFDHDSDPRTPGKRVKNLLEIVRFDKGFSKATRVDVRFGAGSDGEIYWSSKKNGRIYVVTNSIPKWRRRTSTGQRQGRQQQ